MAGYVPANILRPFRAKGESVYRRPRNRRPPVKGQVGNLVTEANNRA